MTWMLKNVISVTRVIRHFDYSEMLFPSYQRPYKTKPEPTSKQPEYNSQYNRKV